MTQQKRYKLIINPKSGSNLRVERLLKLKKYLQERGDLLSIHLTKSLEHAAELTREAVVERFDTIIIAGGDGSVRVVLEAAAGSDVPVLILPSGTENLLACELGLDGTIKNTIDTIERGIVREIDLGCVNGSHFMAVVGIGFDAQVVRYLHHKREGHITPIDYLWPLARSFWSSKYYPVKIIADGQLVCDEPALVFVSNISRYAIGIGIAPGADCCDGYLDLTVFRCHSRWQLLMQSFFTVLKKDHKLTSTTRVKCQNLHISSSENIPVQLDGDDGPNLPLEISVDFAFARILTPPPPIGLDHCPPVRFYHIKRWLLR